MKVIVIGGGGHAKVLIDTLSQLQVEILGYTEIHSNPKGNIWNIPCLGDDEEIECFSPKKIVLVNGLGSTGRTENRNRLFIDWKLKGYTFASIIHPSAVISSRVRLGEGVQVMAGAVIQTGVIIGDNAIVNTRASVDHDCKIDNHAHIAPGAVLSGGVQVEEAVHIGTGAVIIQGLRIGKGSTIGAGSTVIRDVPMGVTVVGSPAKEIKK